MIENSPYEEYFTYDLPIPYKNLLIYPVKMINYIKFFKAVECLNIDKNKNPQAISMSYMDFLLSLIVSQQEYSESLENCFYDVFDLCLHVGREDISFLFNDNGKFDIVVKINDEEIYIDKKDFNVIKKIILSQNIYDYDDTYIDPELKQAIDEANELQNQNLGKTTLERQIIIVCKAYGYKLNEIYDVPIRKFVQMLQVADAQLHYQIYKTGECSGMVSFKEKISHYMYIQDTKFSSLISYDSFKEKMKHVAKI